MKRKKTVSISRADRIFYFATDLILCLMVLIVSYPLLYIVAASFSDPQNVAAGRVFLWPVGFSLRGYEEVFRHSQVWVGYRNTVVYTAAGTSINVAMTMMAAFGLSKRNLPGRNLFTFLFTFTMMFGGGLVPFYLLLRDLKMLNTIWAMLIPGAVSVYNMIVARTFIQSNIPAELSEAASIDGCSDFRYFFEILLPLSKAILAVLALFYAVGHWNSYFNAMIYLRDPSLFPLQIVLREILILNQIDPSAMLDPSQQERLEGMADLLKYSLIVVATVPIMCVYPFVQKYFIKGVMIGSLKG